MSSPSHYLPSLFHGSNQAFQLLHHLFTLHLVSSEQPLIRTEFIPPNHRPGRQVVPCLVSGREEKGVCLGGGVAAEKVADRVGADDGADAQTIGLRREGDLSDAET